MAVAVEAPLRWIAPNRVVDPTTSPPRGRFVLWATEFRTAPRVEVRQGERLLASLRSARPLVPNRPYEISADWLSRVVPAGPPVVVSVR